MTLDGPGIPPALDMVKEANAAYPFSSASAIMDIGCGPGQITGQLLKAHGADLPNSSRIVASDFSSGMLEQIQARKATAIENGDSPWSKVEIVQCDAANLSPFSDNSASHALAGLVLFMVPEPRTALKEIFRVLTDQNGGGVLALSSWQGSEWMELLSFPSKVRPEKSVPKMPPGWGSVEAVRGELEATGFRDTDVHTVDTYMPFDDYDEIARFVLTQFPGMSKMTEDLTSEEMEKVLNMAVEYLKTNHPSVPSRMKGTAIVGIARK